VKVTPCFVDETGTAHEAAQPLFGVGLLLVRDVAALTDRLNTVSLNLNAHVRQQRKLLQREIVQKGDGQVKKLIDFQFLLANSRHHEYKFTEIRPDNVSNYLAILNEFFAFSGSEFHAIVVERDGSLPSLYRHGAWPGYVLVTKTLLRRRLKEPSFVCCDWQTRPKNASLSLETELDDLTHVAGSRRMASNMSVFLQVTDLLLGAVSFDWRDAHGQVQASKSSRPKREVVSFVKAKLGMPPTTRFLAQGQTFFRRKKPFPFTVWQPCAAVLERPRARGMHRGQSRPAG
jgi:hypothetical protein